MKIKKYLVVASMLCGVMLLVMILALKFGQKTYYQPPAFEAAAQTGTPDVPDGLGYSKLSREGMSFSVGVCGKVVMNGNNTDIYLTNYAENTIWMKLRVYGADGNVLGETGIIKPGEYVRDVTLNKSLSTGIPVTLKIMTYEPETYESAGAVSLNTTID